MKITHTFRSGENVCQLSLLFSNFQISKKVMTCIVDCFFNDSEINFTIDIIIQYILLHHLC